MKNTGSSVQARLKNISKESGIDMMFLLRRYVQERLIVRMSMSDEAGNFALKGGLLLAAYNNGETLRPTEDIDFNGMDEHGTVENMRAALVKILSADGYDDGAEFDLTRMVVMKDKTGIIPGGKIMVPVRVGTANVELKVDVGFGNPVTPSLTPIVFPTLLGTEASGPIMNAYPLETVISEKMHAMAQFGDANTRLKDYYDIWVLSMTHEFDADLLSEAIATTFRHQQRAIPDVFDGLSDVFAKEKAKRWSAFLDKLPGGRKETLHEVIGHLSDFILPVIECARTGERTGMTWQQVNGWYGPSMMPSL